MLVEAFTCMLGLQVLSVGMGARARTHLDTPGRSVTWNGSKMLQLHEKQ
jgi:hypothetical protein